MTQASIADCETREMVPDQGANGEEPRRRGCEIKVPHKGEKASARCLTQCWTIRTNSIGMHGIIEVVDPLQLRLHR